MFYTAIAAVSNEGAIGAGLELAVQSRADMIHFANTTKDGVLIMGYKTAKSLITPLPGRINYVLVFNDDQRPIPKDLDKGFQVIGISRDMLESMLHMIAHSHPDQLLFVIGGAQMYEACAPYCSRLYLTEIPKSNPDANVFFPKEAFSGYKEVGRRDLPDGSVIVDYVNPHCLYGISVV